MVFGILIVLLITSIIVLPIIFKDDIIQAVKEAANDNLNAQVDFGDFDVSLISSFPDFSFDIADVSVIGIDSFAGDTLLYMGSMILTVDLMAAINGKYNIKTFAIDGLTANAIVLRDSTANWDIVKASGEEEVEEEEEEVVVLQPTQPTAPTGGLVVQPVVTAPILPTTEEKSLFQSTGFLSALVVGEVLLIIIAIFIVVAVVRKKRD